jgi:nitroreductase
MRQRKTIIAVVIILLLGSAGSYVSAQAPRSEEVKKSGAASDLAVTDHLLTTTRSVRKRLDLSRPVDPKIVEQAINVAIQAPTGSNAQDWYFIVVTDPDKRKAIADLYRKSADEYRNRPRPTYAAGDPRAEQQKRLAKSGAYLYQHLHEVPMFVFAAVEGRFENEPPFMQASRYGSILPAAWSFMLALRARGVGSAWTTLALRYEKEIAKLLGIPDNITLAVMMPVAYYTGSDFKPAKRLPAKEHTYWNTWGQQR